MRDSRCIRTRLCRVECIFDDDEVNRNQSSFERKFNKKIV